MATPRLKGRRNGNGSGAVVSDVVCYCNGERDLGNLELFCSGCMRWYHGKCLKDLGDFLKYGLSFMVCYSFSCKNCSNTRIETWVAKQANFVHMCVTVLANLTADRLRKEGRLEGITANYETHFFSLHEDIIPYFDANWENLTSMGRRVKTTWHATLQKTLAKEPELFQTDPLDDSKYALRESLFDIGPCNEKVRMIGSRKTLTEKSNVASAVAQDKTTDKNEKTDEGPKTRGASKRRNADNSGVNTKKPKAADYSSAKIAGHDSSIDFPFNKDGYRYFLVERDPNVPEPEIKTEKDDAPLIILNTLYRVVNTDIVTISPNDRAYQLRVGDDQMTVTGFEGYCLARATHGVSTGTWYYEVQFLKQPPGTHVRIGWSQPLAVVQSCCGYNKLSYSWRSLKGTKFHEGYGKKYCLGGYKEGDVLGMLIHLPLDINTNVPSSHYLPDSMKDNHLIKFKSNYFYESHEDVAAHVKTLGSLKGSKIEFFLNGKSCGVAYEDIYRGTYYPTVSLFGSASVRCNFGPNVRYPPPPGARLICERPAEVHYEQALSDMLHIVDVKPKPVSPVPST
ncbi:unnamed protein product [Auanema sp. JU1783]|nr:unnamed protein product [Auanema sp. JU1783]